MPETKFNLEPGKTLGRNYYIVDFLGSGWEGEVYKVEERRTGIMRAAKIFYEDHRMKNRAMQRYIKKLYKLRRCPIVTQYHHRDIARVNREQVEILVSDFVEGEMLSDFIKHQHRKRLSIFEALHLLHSLASGVEQVHQLGEYHGDIHSDNIMVKRIGLGFEVHLLDFFDMGQSGRSKIQADVIDLIGIFYEVIGGASGYKNVGPDIRKIILGRKHSLIRQKFKSAGQLRVALENLHWD